MQLDVNVGCGCDIVDVNFVSALSVQIQKLLGKERTVRRQVSCSGKISQKKSALHLRQVYLCNAERAGCAKKQLR